MKGTTVVDVSDDRNWGEVELFRWQYGKLPAPDDFSPLNYPVALKKAAEAVRKGEVDPFNAAEMLKVAGLLIRDIYAAAEPMVRDLDKVIQPEKSLLKLRDALSLPTPKEQEKTK